MPSSSSTDSTLGGGDADAVHGGGFGRELHAFGNLDPLLDAFVMRHHVTAAAADMKFADHGGMGALQDLDDFAIGAAVRLRCGRCGPARGRRAWPWRGIGRDEDIAGDALDGVIGNQEAVAIAVHVEAADGEFAAAGGDGEVAGAQLDQVAAGGQAGEGGFQFRAIVALGSQLAHELFEIGLGVRQAGDVVEKGGVGHTLILLTTLRGLARQILAGRCALKRLTLLLIPAALLRRRRGMPDWANSRVRWKCSSCRGYLDAGGAEPAAAGIGVGADGRRGAGGNRTGRWQRVPAGRRSRRANYPITRGSPRASG